MAETPTNSISIAIAALKLSLSNSSAFQSWAGVGSQVAAAAKIYREAIPVPASGDSYTLTELNDYRPLSIVYVDDNSEGIKFTRDSSHGFMASGRLVFTLEKVVNAALSEDDLRIDNWNDVGAICDDLCTLAGDTSAAYLHFDQLYLLATERTDPNKVATEGDVLVNWLVVEWRGI